jgi:hypothetical protein
MSGKHHDGKAHEQDAHDKNKHRENFAEQCHDVLPRTAPVTE